MLAPAESKAEILPLTSLRFVAALAVVLFHTVREPFPSLANGGLLSRLIGAGYVSVSFFFVLSGYILSIVYFASFRPIDRGKFWKARFARCYPVFVLTMLLDLPAAVQARLDHLTHTMIAVKISAGFVVECLLLQSWHLNWRVLDPPNWSISDEAFFYLLFPFIGLAWEKLRQRNRLTLCFAIWIVSLIANVMISRFDVAEKAVLFNPLLHLSEFLAGICTASYQRHLNEDSLERLKTFSPVLFVGATIAFLAAVAFLNVPRVLMNNGLLVPVFAVIILLFRATTRASQGCCPILGWSSLGEPAIRST